MFNQSDLKEHMEVLGSDGKHLGTIDHLEGPNQIKLTKTDSPDGKHHVIPVDWIDHVDQHVHLNKTSKDAQAKWKSAA